MKTYLLVLIGFVAFACNHLEEGKVISKRYEPATHYPILIPMRVGKITTLIPMMMYDDEDYVLIVKGTYQGEEREETVYVSRQCYQQLNSGDRWIKTNDCSFEDNNNTQVRR